jgi:predicted alpha/beta hydrolase family esterase
MTSTRQILFVQGGGAGAHDEWDDKLVKSLRRELGDGYEVRYPRMPDEGDPGCARWSTAIRREMADLGDGAVAAGHSVGATILVNTLAEQPPGRGIAAIVLIAAPIRRPGRLARRRVRADERPGRQGQREVLVAVGGGLRQQRSCA